MIAGLRYRARSHRRRLFGWRPYPDADEPVCVLCGSDRRETVGRRVAFEMRYRTVMCSDCGLVYLCPRPAAGSFAHFYTELYPTLYGARPPAEEPSGRGRAVAAFLLEGVDPSSHFGLLDVGCGDGGLLRAVADEPRLTALRLAGSEPGWPRSHDTVLDQGGVSIEIFREPVEELEAVLGGFSIFVLYDVLEHLLDPREFLRLLHARAPVGAVLFISTNCLDNWSAIPTAGWERYYLRLAHTYTFTERTLAALLAGTGWHTVRRLAAEKGDQWVLAERAAPLESALGPLPGHADAVRSMISSYRVASV